MRILIDGTWVDTTKAGASWQEKSRIRDELEAEALFRSSAGRYYIAVVSYGLREPTARFVTDEVAAKWLFINEHDLPDDLKQYEIKTE